MENEVIVEKKKTTRKAAPKPKTPPKTKIDPKTGTLKVVETKKQTEKKKTTSKAKKSTAKSTTKSTTKKTTTSKPKRVKKEEPVKPIIVETTPEVVDVPVEINDVVNIPNDIETDHTISEQSIEEIKEEKVDVEEQPIVEKAVVTEPKRRGRKPSENPLPKKSSRELTIEPPKRQPKEEPKKEEKKNLEPEVIVRPKPKKVHNFTKEEKVLYKALSESFNYVANLTNVIEERTMDTKLINDLTIGELHVIEAVDKLNNKPMSLIAKYLKVTVGSLTISINRLVQKGYLLRTRHEMDHRIILVSITPKGKKVLKVHDAFHETILGLVLDSITLAQAHRVMTQFSMVLENYFDPKSISTIMKKGNGK